MNKLAIVCRGMKKYGAFFITPAGVIGGFAVAAFRAPEVLRGESSPEILIIKKPDIDGFELGCIFGSGADLKFKDIAGGGENLGIVFIG